MERGENSSIRSHRGQGSSNSQAKLSENQVREICQLLQDTNLSAKQIGDKYNVAKSTIANISRGKNWRDISVNYNFSGRKSIRDPNTGRFIVINSKIPEV